MGIYDIIKRNKLPTIKPVFVKLTFQQFSEKTT